ncbi:MAG: amidohydrolase family protein [Desulfuromonadales bacterium]|nr:amidohydrolase family protein [Desulfuromonadales bacterium]
MAEAAPGAAFLAGTGVPSPPIIDLHVHVAGIGAGASGCHVSPRLLRNWRYGIYLRAFGVTVGELARQGDALVVRRVAETIAASQWVAGGVLLALDGVVDSRGELDLERTEVYVPNRFVRAAASYPQLFYGASVNPLRHDALARLEQAAADGAVLIKWLPAIQQIDPADPRCTPFYRRLGELGLPLLVHTGAERSFTTSHPELGDPQRLRLPLELGVTVIAAHAATTGRSQGEDNMLRLLAMLPVYPHLYTDISSLTQLNKLRYLPRLLRRTEVHDRLLYGTDFPLINTRLVSPWYFPFALTASQRREIARLTNPWDRDVALKAALGFPPEVFTRGALLIQSRIRGEDSGF